MRVLFRLFSSSVWKYTIISALLFSNVVVVFAEIDWQCVSPFFAILHYALSHNKIHTGYSYSHLFYYFLLTTNPLFYVTHCHFSLLIVASKNPSIGLVLFKKKKIKYYFILPKKKTQKKVKGTKSFVTHYLAKFTHTFLMAIRTNSNGFSFVFFFFYYVCEMVFALIFFISPCLFLVTFQNFSSLISQLNNGCVQYFFSSFRHVYCSISINFTNRGYILHVCTPRIDIETSNNKKYLPFPFSIL